MKVRVPEVLAFRGTGMIGTEETAMILERGHVGKPVREDGLSSGPLSEVNASTRPTGQLNPMALQETSDDTAAGESTDLMKKVQQGDMEAYQELIRRYQKKVFRVISTHVRNQEDAMEVLQDTFLKVFTARQTWDGRFSFSGWLYRIAINASIDRYRRSDRGRTSSLEDVMETQVHQSATGRPAQDPHHRMHDQDRRRLLEEAVHRLPPRQREVVSLRFFGEMRLEEIAAALDCPLGTVKSNLHKAIMGLKDMLHKQKGALIYE
jgi:RNA polymerase sigma-70 factor (ECF subfamily)